MNKNYTLVDKYCIIILNKNFIFQKHYTFVNKKTYNLTHGKVII